MLCTIKKIIKKKKKKPLALTTSKRPTFFFIFPPKSWSYMLFFHLRQSKQNSSIYIYLVPQLTQITHQQPLHTTQEAPLILYILNSLFFFSASSSRFCAHSLNEGISSWGSLLLLGPAVTRVSSIAAAPAPSAASCARAALSFSSGAIVGGCGMSSAGSSWKNIAHSCGYFWMFQRRCARFNFLCWHGSQIY